MKFFPNVFLKRNFINLRYCRFIVKNNFNYYVCIDLRRKNDSTYFGYVRKRRIKMLTKFKLN